MKIKSSLLAGLATLLLLSGMSGDLKEITKPYLGVYECVEAKINGENYGEDFAYIHLELKSDETFILYYKEKKGEERRETGKYQYNPKDKTVTMRLDEHAFFKREFPLEKGILTINVPIGEHIFLLKFKQK